MIDRHFLLSYGGLLRCLMSGEGLPVIIDEAVDESDPTIPMGAVPWKDGPTAAVALAMHSQPPRRIARFEWRAVSFALKGTEEFPGWPFERSALVAVPGNPISDPAPIFGNPESLMPRLPSREERFARAGHPGLGGHRPVDEVERLEVGLAASGKPAVTLGAFTVIRLSDESVAVLRGPLGPDAQDPLLRRHAGVEMIVALTKQGPPVDRTWAEAILSNIASYPRADARISESPEGLRILEGLTSIV